MPGLPVITLFRNIRYVISLALVAEIIYAFCNRGVWIEGHFDNPAGFAMFVVACFPFLYCIDCVQRNSYVRHSVEILFMAIMAATGSRTGIIALTFIIGLAYCKTRKREFNVWAKTVAAASLCIMPVILYFLKKDSADGRVLIWKCTCNMIAQKPILGYGADGFRKYYMNFQEQYFAENPDSIYANLADNIVHPFNEYLQIIVNYGFVGFGILIILIIFLIHMSRQDAAAASFDSVLSLTGIGVFALFSYPFSYAVCRFLIIYNVIGITCLWKRVPCNITPRHILVLCFAMLAVGLACRQSLATKRAAYETWHRLNQQFFDNNSDKQEAHEAGDILNDAEYWYELAARFCFLKMYEDCLSAASRSEDLNNNSDVQILKGICMAELGEQGLAERHYRSAHNMCPKLIKPLYLMVKLYEQAGDTAKAKSMALQVLDKKEKVKSFETDLMKDDLKKYITSDL